MTEKKLLVALVATTLFFTNQQAQADILINNSSSTPQSFIESDSTLTVSGAGDLNVTSADAVSAGNGAGFSGLNIVVNTSDPAVGIKSTGGSAIAIYSTNSLSSIQLDSGTISSSTELGSAILLSGSGTTAITTAVDTTISNDLVGSAITANTASNIDLTITNAGTISATNLSNSIAIGLTDNDGGSTLAITNSGAITADVTGTAIKMTDAASSSNSATITNDSTGEITGRIIAGKNDLSLTNSGTITGNISATSGFLSVINTGDIIGDVALGSNSSSILRLNSGSITGNVTLGPSAGVDLVWRDGASINGTVRGASSGDGFISIGFFGSFATETITANGNIGDGGLAVGSLVVQNLATFNLGNNSLITNGGIYLAQSATINIGSGTIAGDIKGTIPFSGTSNNAGTVNFTEDRTLSGNVGTSTGRSLHAVNISSGKTIDSGDYTINATNISLAANATLTTSKTISGGGDSLGANLTNSTISLDSGATLALTNGANIIGDIEGSANNRGDVTAAGTVAVAAIGASNSIHDFTSAANSNVTFSNDISASSVTINGNAIFSSAATTINANTFSVNSGGALSLTISNPTTTALEVAGAALISSNITLNLTISGTINSGTVITLLDASSASTIGAISDANININNSGTNLFDGNLYSTSVLGNQFLLTATTAHLTFENPNAQNVYDAIQSATSPNGELNTLKNYLAAAHSMSEKSAALQSATPEVDNSSNRIAFNIANGSLDLTSNRLQSLYNSANRVSKNQYAANHRVKSDVIYAQNNISNAVWGEIFGQNLNQGNGTISQGYKANSRGFTFGFDREFDENFFAGISASYVNSDVKSRSALKSSNINSYQVNIYSGQNFEKFFFNSLLGFVWNEYQSSRAIPITASLAKANYSGQTYIARVESGTNLKLENGFILTPSITLTSARNDIANYNESGAGTLNLNVKTRSANFFETRGGIILSNKFTAFNHKIEPQISTSYGYDFFGNKQKTSSNFINQSNTFDSTASNVAQGSLKMGFGAKIHAGDDLTLNANYVFEHRANYQASSVLLRMGYKF